MTVFFESDYITLQMENDNTLIRFSYKEDGASENMDEEDYKKIMLIYAEEVEKYLPPNLLVDMRYSKFLVDIELQEWTAKEIDTRTTCLKKMAFVVSSDIFSQVSTEQMMQEKEIASNYDEPRYFDTIEEAEKWLGI